MVTRSVLKLFLISYSVLPDFDMVMVFNLTNSILFYQLSGVFTAILGVMMC